MAEHVKAMRVPAVPHADEASAQGQSYKRPPLSARHRPQWTLLRPLALLVYVAPCRNPYNAPGASSSITLVALLI
jgi:hypothetical protein